jgi:hypothetical protein
LRKYTSRGFRNYSEQKDSYGTPFAVRESSNAELRAVWIFIHDPEYGKPVVGGIGWPALHLSVAQAKRLVVALNKFIEGK